MTFRAYDPDDDDEVLAETPRDSTAVPRKCQFSATLMRGLAGCELKISLLNKLYVATFKN